MCVDNKEKNIILNNMLRHNKDNQRALSLSGRGLHVNFMCYYNQTYSRNRLCFRGFACGGRIFHLDSEEHICTKRRRIRGKVRKAERLGTGVAPTWS